MRSAGAVTIAAFAVLLLAPTATAGAEGPERLARAGSTAIVGYRSEVALKAALAKYPGTILRRLAVLGAAEVRPHIPLARFAASVRRLPGIAYVQRPRPRTEAAEPALLTAPSRATPYQWQWYATRTHLVPEWALRAAANVTVAVIDTGADVSAPDLAAKAPQGFDLDTGSTSIEDAHGHGTFVASLAAGSVTNGEGIAGSGGDARLLVIRAGTGKGRFTDLDEARAIVAAVERGARIINLSFGGARTSATEQRAIEFAASRGVLLVAAVGNDFSRGNPVEYPAALLQPERSNGNGGVGLAVAASTATGKWAPFSNTGSWVSLAAPGEGVFAAVSSLSSPTAYPRVQLPGSSSGLYGFGTGTSYAAPQVAGAAAIVWGANLSLTAADVARILKDTAQGGGRWTPELGYGVVDVATAVARATGQIAAPATDLRTVPFILSASKTKVRAATRVALTATLAPGKEIVLELLGPGGWREQARAVADPDGKVKW